MPYSEAFYLENIEERRKQRRIERDDNLARGRGLDTTSKTRVREEFSLI